MLKAGVIICVLVGTVLPAMPGSAAPTAVPATLEGPTWRLASLPGQDPATLAALPGGVTVKFTDGQLQAFAGCNRLRGGYTLAGDRVTLGPLAGTMMACPDPAMTIENAFKEALTGTLRFAVAQDRLTLTSSTDRTLVFAAVAAPSLEGTTWEVTGFNNGRDAVVSPLPGTTLTLSFRDGMIVGSSGCNTFRATYTHDGDRLAVGPVASTRKACAGAGVMEQEHEYLAAIESATTWQIERDLLDVHRADGQRVLTAHQTAPTP